MYELTHPMRIEFHICTQYCKIFYWGINYFWFGTKNLEILLF